MDRIDLHVEVVPVPFEDLNRRAPGEPSAAVRERVIAARERQAARFKNVLGVHANAQMPSRLVREHCQLDDAGQNLLKMAMNRLGLSARAYDRILKVSRTIADLDAAHGDSGHGDTEHGSANSVTAAHISEAIQYRSLDRSWWNG